MTIESGPRKLTNEEIEAVSGGVTPPPNLNAEGRKDLKTPGEMTEALTDIRENNPHPLHP